MREAQGWAGSPPMCRACRRPFGFSMICSSKKWFIEGNQCHECVLLTSVRGNDCINWMCTMLGWQWWVCCCLIVTLPIVERGVCWPYPMVVITFEHHHCRHHHHHHYHHHQNHHHHRHPHHHHHHHHRHHHQSLMLKLLVEISTSIINYSELCAKTFSEAAFY